MNFMNFIKTKFKFHLTSHSIESGKKMNRRQRKDGKQTGENGKMDGDKSKGMGLTAGEWA